MLTHYEGNDAEGAEGAAASEANCSTRTVLFLLMSQSHLTLCLIIFILILFTHSTWFSHKQVPAFCMFNAILFFIFFVFVSLLYFFHFD